MGQGRVLFLDGIGCNPTGFKPRFITDLGYCVIAPMLSDLDFPAAVAAADRAAQEDPPDVIVGYSRGAGVAMMMKDRRIPRVLIAPALRWVVDRRGADGPVVVLHSATDDGLPLEGVQANLCRCDLAAAHLRVVGDDHSMIDAAALAALKSVLTELARASRAEPDTALDAAS